MRVMEFFQITKAFFCQIQSRIFLRMCWWYFSIQLQYIRIEVSKFQNGIMKMVQMNSVLYFKSFEVIR